MRSRTADAALRPSAASDWRAPLLALLDDYRQRNLGRANLTRAFSEFVERHPDCAMRQLAVGHVTASAWLVSADSLRVLLTHHRKLDRWLQLGGHLDGDSCVIAAALREATEESGLRELAIERALFDLDRHRIPACADEAEHWHYDLRFVVRAAGSEEFVVSAESHALRWCAIDSLAEDPEADPSVARMARLWRQRVSPSASDARG